MALGLAVLLVLTATLLPYLLRAWAVRNLETAGFIILTRESSLPGDIFDRPVSVMTHKASARPHLWSFRHVGPLEDVVLIVEPGLTDIFRVQPKLSGLGLRNGEITPEILEAMTGLPELESVAFEDCRIDAATLQQLSRLPKLKQLSLAGTPLDAECVRSLAGLRSLELLALERTGAPESEVQKLQDALPSAQITDD